MPDSTPTDAGSQEPGRASAETHQRFQRLRVLIYDQQRRQRLLFMLSMLGLAIVSLMAFLAYRSPTLPFDLASTRELQAIQDARFLRFMVTVSLLGYMPWAAVTVGAGALLVGGLFGWRDSAYLLLLTMLQGLANQLIKTSIGRPRPLTTLVEVFAPVLGNSFPSGHVMFYTVFFGFLFFLAWTRLPHSLWRIIALSLTGGLVILIGSSRIYLGAHWLSDVIAAHLLGFIILTFGIEFYLRYLVRT